MLNVENVIHSPVVTIAGLWITPVIITIIIIKLFILTHVQNYLRLAHYM